MRGAVHTAVAADVGSFDRVVLTVDDDVDIADVPVNVTFSTRELKVREREGEEGEGRGERGERACVRG